MKMLKNMVDVDARISTSLKNILHATAIGLFLTVSTPAISQNTPSAIAASAYPTKPIRVVVPSPPGGPPDLIMRMLAPKLSASLGQWSGWNRICRETSSGWLYLVIYNRIAHEYSSL
jgi:hypothetical protein